MTEEKSGNSKQGKSYLKVLVKKARRAASWPYFRFWVRP